jgi:hypothetical protein
MIGTQVGVVIVILMLVVVVSALVLMSASWTPVANPAWSHHRRHFFEKQRTRRQRVG